MYIRTYLILTLQQCFTCNFEYYLEPKKCESKEDGTTKEFDLWEAWKHYKDNSKSIEVLYKNDENQKVLAKVHFRTCDTVSGSYTVST